ncbi:hypothetical protein EJD97_022497 [Solanum chilense]|uniref:AtC3H23-like CCCH zinc finger domain-containing protein n=1 Tax=Solanum chilense TaxID=4083 RepID=A0A6N2C3K6_SOLCI|nr:hypothetical protein EJD97_022497 [Solanum chilense]
MAYRNNHLFNYCSSPFPCHQQFGRQEDDYQEFIDQALCESDEFRMYTYKIKRCSNLHSHDWTSCPFTHRGEKARRRDPREYNYLPIPCPGYKFASCVKGDSCELSHGVFEYWLHPAKYRTHPCHAGTLCDRRVCFFAHTLKELRPETKYNWCYVYRYPLHIQPYPDILIEDTSKGIWIIIPCNYHQSPPPSHDSTIVSEPENSSHQSQPKIHQTFQNRSDFSLFSTSHSKLIEELKNLEIGSTSHAKVNIIDDEKGKKPVECEFEEENQNFNWVTDLLVDDISL